MSPPTSVPRRRPDPGDYEETESLTLPPAGADPAIDRFKVRMCNLHDTDELADFAVIQQTRHRGEWTNVVVVDSSHADEVHLHRYGRRAGEHASTELLLAVTCLADVQVGYERAYEQVFDKWADNKQRWHDG